ncbi:Stk1 family PASTA domain-containing Ser/Thr kinase [Glycomyces sp. L485]|uniref:Stk1 family PASTA domain-containing Ser/Thr kinase n=1 Tax=Glycomyces sp. L485 TaxID=2909235 RepID=UPI001F4AB1FA|nr:Stk1 family PASTA domain-containing Ser/Thr kinase [Glycomyces sp. L485]MCH7229495.1 Stk1 family PASTA domain-containing Ser/Thr kinase [Glycomyces sp. L485]
MTTEPRLLGGRYEIGEVVGYGGMAEVHQGRDLRLGRDVAVKLLRADLSRDESFLVRFRREAQNSASLNHPNIVAVFDTGEEHGIPYMVMEFVTGRTLKEVLIAEGRFDYVNACEIVADMCSALDFSHKHHIIHRDVKPGNVMLSDTNQVKVMDFGIARALASGQATMTQTSAVIGTAQYLSPEQARGETVDGRSDVYAVGCVLYELLVGHPPFTGDNPVSVAYQHVREDARPPSELNPAVPASVDAVVMKALSKNPENRYRTAGEMREDLIRAARGEAVGAPMVMGAEARTQIIGGADSTAPISPIETQSSRRRPWLVALGVIAALALVGLAAWGIMRAMETPPTVIVPQVVGLSEEEATERLTESRLGFVVEREAATDVNDDRIDSVIEQSEEPDSEVGEGTEVTIVVLDPPGEVEMPNVVGDDVDEVRELLEGDDYQFVVTVEEESSARPAGEVLGQDPREGEMLDKGSEVTLTVSEGGQSQVPDLFGLVENVAIDRLQNAGFEPEVVYGTGGGSVGAVYSQSPDAGSTEPDGTTVTITVQGVEVVWDEATTAQDLQTTLEAADLNVTIEGDEGATAIESVSGPDGALSSGDVVAVGSDITIVTVPEDEGGGGGGDDPPTDEECNPLTDPECDPDGDDGEG